MSFQESDFWVTEYSTVTSIFSKFLEMYITVFSIYLGIHGLALKFAFDQNANLALRRLLSVFAISCCMLLFVVVMLAELMRRRLLGRRNRALGEIGVSIPDEFIGAKWGGMVFSFFNVVVLVGWSIVLWSSF